MVLSWNEINDRALNFSKEWSGETRERAEKDSFWNDFFNIFGISRRRVASFEEPVKKLGEKQGFIDLFWKGTLLVEHKSKGKDLDKAYKQAIEYFPGLKEHELPKYILISDFERFRLYDLDEKTEHEFHLSELRDNIQLFGFIAGYQKRIFKEEDPVNIQAAELMGRLHDQLKEFGYEGHALEMYLVRLLFVLFADDTSIFEKDIFKEFLEQKTNEDGSDLGALLAQFFQVLNTPEEKRLRNLDEHLTHFPYINGKLFEEALPIAAFNSKMRNILIEASALDWGKISPAIFGSLFQSVMNPEQRRNLGAHYTSEKNILKVIKPLFLDNLRKEFEKVKSKKPKLREFHKKLSTLTFLDPACGSGNFLIITYRELRQLEMDVLKELYKSGEMFIDIANIVWIDVDQFYGIEIDEFPARIAEVAMWLIDHQMNMKISDLFGFYFARLPLKKAAKIVHGNALRIDWNSLISGEFYDITADEVNIKIISEQTPHYETLNIETKKVNIGNDDELRQKQLVKFDYIFGNPPFVGKSNQSKQQKEDMKLICDGVKGAGVLDYVTAWYIKAAQYIQKTKIKVAFVSTNSISQGEQVGILWGELLNKYKIKIHFAHRTFNWSNEAKKNAAVHVVIVGFGNYAVKENRLFEYHSLNDEPHEIKARNINGYLVAGIDIVLLKRTTPICEVHPMSYGSMPNDGGNLVFDTDRKNQIIALNPNAEKFIHRFVMGEELINNIDRWALWIEDKDLKEVRTIKPILEILDAVREKRLSSPRKATQKLAAIPYRFGEVRQPTCFYIAFPRVSSMRRKYIPITILSKEIISGDKVYTISLPDMFYFGIITSEMHMAWMRYTAGRMKSDFSYTNQITYNNYPWPKELNSKNKKRVEEKAQKVLDVRAEFPESSLADLYDPLTMPPTLMKAHQELDKAVDKCYRTQPFATENARIEFLFDLYSEYVASEKNKS